MVVMILLIQVLYKHHAVMFPRPSQNLYQRKVII